MASEGEMEQKEELTVDQKELIQRNKERARALKEQRRRVKPYDRPGGGVEKAHSISLHAQSHHQELQHAQRNSHAGFMFDSEEESASQQHRYRQIEEEGNSEVDSRNESFESFYAPCCMCA